MPKQSSHFEFGKTDFQEIVQGLFDDHDYCQLCGQLHKTSTPATLLRSIAYNPVVVRRITGVFPFDQTDVENGTVEIEELGTEEKIRCIKASL